MKNEINYLVACLEDSVLASKVLCQIEDRWSEVDIGLIFGEGGINFLRSKEDSSILEYRDRLGVPEKNVLILKEISGQDDIPISFISSDLGSYLQINPEVIEDPEPIIDQAIQSIFTFIMGKGD
jgi:hypothetical protein